MTSPPPKRALDRGALIPPREAPAPFPDSAFVAPDRALDVACHALERRSPAYSARIVLVRWQRLLLVAGIVSSLAGLVFLPGPTGAPDGEPLSTRITLPGHTGLLALRP